MTTSVQSAGRRTGWLPQARRLGQAHPRARLAVIRTLSIIPTLFFVSVLVFVAGRLTLQNASISALGFFATPEAKAQFEEEFNLDRGLAMQYWLWLKGVVQGDFGMSLITRTPVSDSLAGGFEVTISLAVGAIVLATIAGLGIGTASGLMRASARRFVSSGTLLGISLPQFWLGLVLLVIFSVKLGWLPGGGFVPPSESLSEFFKSMLLPWVTLAVGPACVVARITQVRTAEEANKPHVISARGLGVARRTIRVHYIQRNAIAEPLTVLGIQVGYMLGGVFLVEQVFNLPGLGQLALTAVHQSDYPVVQAVALYAILAFLLASLAVDLLLLSLNVRLAGR